MWTRVPDDLRIVGFDDIPEAAYLTPPLTTIRQDFDAVGRAALTTLLQAINDPAPAISDPLLAPSWRSAPPPPPPTG